jgi:hypothetical protein
MSIDLVMKTLERKFTDELEGILIERAMLPILFNMLSPFQIMNIKEAQDTFALFKFNQAYMFDICNWIKYREWYNLYYSINQNGDITFLIPIIPDVNCVLKFIADESDYGKLLYGECSGCEENVVMCICCNDVDSSMCICSFLQGICVLTIPSLLTPATKVAECNTYECSSSLLTPAAVTTAAECNTYECSSSLLTPTLVECNTDKRSSSLLTPATKVAECNKEYVRTVLDSVVNMHIRACVEGVNNVIKLTPEIIDSIVNELF